MAVLLHARSGDAHPDRLPWAAKTCLLVGLPRDGSDPPCGGSRLIGNRTRWGKSLNHGVVSSVAIDHVSAASIDTVDDGASAQRKRN